MGHRERVQADQALPRLDSLNEVQVSVLQLPVRMHDVQRLAVSRSAREVGAAGRVGVSL